MIHRTLFRKLLRDLWSRKGALAALVVIVTIGVGAYIGMAAVFRDLDGARQRYYDSKRLADFVLDCKRAPAWAVRELEVLPNVRRVQGRVNVACLLDLPGRDEPVAGAALSLPEERVPVINDVLLRRGVWFSGKDDREVILNDAFAKAHGIQPGDRIRALLLDKQHDLLVVGTAMSPEFVYLIPPGGGLAPDPAGYGILYLTEDFLRKSCDLEGAWNQVIGQARDASRPALAEMLALMEERLDAYGVTNTTPVQEIPSARFLHDELHGLKTSSTLFPVIFLSVAALVLNVLLGRLVAQQRSVIGTLRALGYTRGDVTRHFLGFGVTIGVAGGVGGLLMGLWIETSMVAMYRRFFALPRIEAHFYPDIYLVGLAISVGFALAGAFKGAHSAAAMAPAESMRPPPPERGGAVLPERIPWVWTRLPFRWKMILRSVFRNPFRSSVCVVASAISTALILMVLTNLDALHYLMRYEFERVSRQDLTVSLREPKGRRAADEVRRLPNVAETESQLAVVCDLSRGERRKRTGVTGLPRANRLYTPLDARGLPIVMPDAGLVLTRKLSEILDARPGQTVRLRPLIAERKEVTAPVVAVVDTYLGLSAYADQRYLSALLGEAFVSNTLLNRLESPSAAPKDVREAARPFLEALKQRPAVVGFGMRTRSLTRLNETFGKTMGTMIVVMILFAGLIAFGSVLNAALVSLSERQRDVATLRVLGYSTRQVAGIFAGESGFLNAVGVVLGLAAGCCFARLVSMAYNTEMFRFPVVIHPSRLLETAAIMVLFVGVAQLIVYRLIRALNWLESLNVKE